MGNPQFALTIQNGPESGRTFTLTTGSHIIGRTPGNHIHIADPTISKQHARITVQANGAFIEDLGSANGTFINGQRITASTWLKPGDTLQIGTVVTLKVSQPGSPDSIADLGPTYIPGRGAGSPIVTSDFSLVIRQGAQPGQAFPLVNGVQTIGRTSGNQIFIADSTISKQHARITVQPNGVFIQDLDSSNGTFVNGQRISTLTPLQEGDVVQVGTTVTLGVKGSGGFVSAQAAPTPKSRGLGIIMIAGLAVLLIILGLGAAAWFVLQPAQIDKSRDDPTATVEPTATEEPTPAPVPKVVMEFDVDKNSVKLGECATLRWRVEDSKEVRLDGELVSNEGSHKVCPQESSKTYRLTALSLNGEIEEKSITLTVPPTLPPPPGVEIEFTAGQTTVNFGECTTLRWNVQNANEVRRETKKVALIGTEQVCPTEPNNTYALLVQTLEGENVERIVSITVPPTPVPTATPTSIPTATPKPQPQNPIIDKFITDQNSLNQGSCTTLRWQVRNAQTVRLDGNQVANQGSQRVCPTASTNTYNLVATGAGGGSVQSSLTLSVIVPTPTPVIIYVQPTPVYVPPPVFVPSGPPKYDIGATVGYIDGNRRCFTLQGYIENVKEAYLNGGKFNNKPLTGPSWTEGVCHKNTTTYVMTVILPDGRSDSVSVTREGP